MTVIPYKDSSKGKKEQIAQMFDNISHRYDILNRIMTLGIDQSWRKKALKCIKENNPKLMLDIATGTADFAIMANDLLNPDKIVGIDISNGMLSLGKEKINKLDLNNKIELKLGDSENIPFPDNNFDAVTVSYGVRNFENLEKGLQEILRVLKPGGKLCVLEASEPENKIIKVFYILYFQKFLPKIGKLISGDNAAYSYLPESVSKFPQGEAFLKILKKLDYKDTKWIPLTFGASSIYIAEK